MISKQANLFLAPVRRKRAGESPRLNEDAPAAHYQQQGPATTEQHGQHHQPSPRLYATGPTHQEGKGQATSVPKWFSAHKTLCETCWALRTGASAAGGSKCQRCGRTHVRGFSHELSKRGGDDAADPVPWQQFSQVRCRREPFRCRGSQSLRCGSTYGVYSLPMLPVPPGVLTTCSRRSTFPHPPATKRRDISGQ